jgi:hypothetical protein
MWCGPDFHTSQLWWDQSGTDDREHDPAEEGEPEEYAQ